MSRAEKIREVAAEYEHLTGYIDDARFSIERLNEAVGPAATALKGFAANFGAIFDIQQAINAGYREGTQQGGATREATTKDHDEDIARRFENLENELKHAFGKDNFAAATIDNVVKGLRAGVLTPNQAMEVVRGVLGAYFQGGQLFGALGSPDPEIRKVAEEMARLLASGNLNA